MPNYFGEIRWKNYNTLRSSLYIPKKKYLDNFKKLGLRFYRCLNPLYSGRYGYLLYKDRKFEIIPKLFLQCNLTNKVSLINFKQNTFF